MECKTITLIVLFIVVDVITADWTTKTIEMPSRECNEVAKWMSAAHIVSNSNDTKEESCVLKLKTSLSKVMIRYIHVSLDCDVSLHVYYGKEATGKPNKEFDCHSVVDNPEGLLDFTDSVYITVSLNKTLGDNFFNFSILVTSYEEKDFNNGCGNRYACSYDAYGDSMCINPDLKCDSHRNCADGSDEGDSCKPATPGQVALSIFVLIVIIGGVVGIVFACRKWGNFCNAGGGGGRRGRGVRQPQIVVRPTIEMTDSAVGGPPQPMHYYPAGSQGVPPPPPPSGGYAPVPQGPPGGYSAPAGSYPTQEKAPLPASYQPAPGSYQAPPPGSYQAPPGSYQSPPGSYQSPPGSYQAPPPGSYQAPPGSYQPPPGSYQPQAPPANYQVEAPPAYNPNQ